MQTNHVFSFQTQTLAPRASALAPRETGDPVIVEPSDELQLGQHAQATNTAEPAGRAAVAKPIPLAASLQTAGPILPSPFGGDAPALARKDESKQAQGRGCTAFALPEISHAEVGGTLLMLDSPVQACDSRLDSLPGRPGQFDLPISAGQTSTGQTLEQALEYARSVSTPSKQCISLEVPTHLIQMDVAEGFGGLGPVKGASQFDAMLRRRSVEQSVERAFSLPSIAPTLSKIGLDRAALTQAMTEYPPFETHLTPEQAANPEVRKKAVAGELVLFAIAEDELARRVEPEVMAMASQACDSGDLSKLAKNKSSPEMDPQLSDAYDAVHSRRLLERTLTGPQDCAAGMIWTLKVLGPAEPGSPAEKTYIPALSRAAYGADAGGASIVPAREQLDQLASRANRNLWTLVAMNAATLVGTATLALTGHPYLAAGLGYVGNGTLTSASVDMRKGRNLLSEHSDTLSQLGQVASQGDLALARHLDASRKAQE